MRQLGLALAILASTSLTAAAALNPANLKDAGDWRLSEVGGKIACTLTLTREASFAGYALKAPLACRRAFPALRAVAAWAIDEKGGIVLTDAHAAPIITFPAQAAGGSYEAKSPDGRTWRLEPLKPDGAPAGGPPPSAEKPAPSA
jgi:hypothetical protein